MTTTYFFAAAASFTLLALGHRTAAIVVFAIASLACGVGSLFERANGR
jgi:hypothetical protein